MCIFSCRPMPMWRPIPFYSHCHCGFSPRASFNLGMGFAVGTAGIGLLGAVLNRLF